MIELSRCRWITRPIAGAKPVPVGRNGPDGKPLPDRIPKEIRVEFHEADVAKILEAVPYPGDKDKPISAWWSMRGEVWELLVGARDTTTGRAVEPAETWAWQIRGRETLKSLCEVIPQASLRVAEAVWEKPSAEDAPPKALIIRLLAGKEGEKKGFTDTLDTIDVPQLLSILVTEKIPHDRKTAKTMQKPDLVALIRKYRTPAKPALVL